MTSLAEVYDGVGGTSLRRFYLGTALFIAGACLLILGILVGTTDAMASLDVGLFEARRIAGVLAGLGVPAVFVGIFIVLPADARERATAAIGASIAVFGVVLFWQVYPDQWLGATQNHLTLPVVAVYFLGVITTFWSLFTAIVNFKTRNDPGGTITLERTIGGETHLVEVPVSELTGTTLREGTGTSGVGVLGDVDRNAVIGESNDGVLNDDATVIRDDDDPTGDDQVTPASDGGTVTKAARPVSPSRPSRSVNESDRYCGNCAFFDYTRDDDGLQPYCNFHDRSMNDMEACDHWSPNSP